MCCGCGIGLSARILQRFFCKSSLFGTLGSPVGGTLPWLCSNSHHFRLEHIVVLGIRVLRSVLVVEFIECVDSAVFSHDCSLFGRTGMPI